MTSDDEARRSGDGMPVVVIDEVIRGIPPTTWLQRDAAYRDAMVPPVLQPHLPPSWAVEERPTRPHRRGDCDAESAAGRTKKSKSGRAEHCCCGGRRPLTVEGDPLGGWFDLNSEVISSAAPDDRSAAAGGTGFWRRVLWFLAPAKESLDDTHIPLD